MNTVSADTAEMREPPGSPLPRTAAIFVGEALAMFIYVFLGAGTEASARVLAYLQHRPFGEADWLLVAFAHGMGLFVGTIITKWIGNAHANPAVTIGLAVVGRFRWRQVPMQLIAQFLGATLGAAAVLIVFGRVAATVGHLGAAELAPGVSLVQAMAIEGIGTAILAMTVLATSVDSRAPQGWAAFSAGMAVLVVTTFMGPATSALINPARAFAPEAVNALLGVSVNWAEFAIAYLAGPLIGASVTCAVYMRITGPRRVRQ